MEVSIGGQRIGSGSRMKAEMPHYEMSTHNLSKVTRMTIAAGTLNVVFKMLVQPGDIVKMNINALLLTLPTVGPMLGSAKFQIDVFSGDMRLYNADLHNNTLGLGLDMTKAKFPQISLRCARNTANIDAYSNIQVNPSSIMSHLS